MSSNIGGKIWSEIRQALARHRERLIAAFDAKAYEAENNLLDDIARKITEQVEDMVNSEIQALRESLELEKSNSSFWKRKYSEERHRRSRR